jgi:hypothetical protein
VIVDCIQVSTPFFSSCESYPSAFHMLRSLSCYNAYLLYAVRIRYWFRKLSCRTPCYLSYYNHDNASHNLNAQTLLLFANERAVERVCCFAFWTPIPIWTNALCHLLSVIHLCLKGRCVLVNPLQLSEMAIQDSNNM